MREKTLTQEGVKWSEEDFGELFTKYCFDVCFEGQLRVGLHTQ